MPIIAPSLLASDFLRLADECKMLNESEADWFHLDVMDGRFVPNISFGIPVVAQIRTATTKFCDVHLMIEEPERYTHAFHQAGADQLTVHIEACRHLHRNIQQIKELGMSAGVALNPHTPVTALWDILPDIGIVNLMSVNPGFGGQKFISNSIEKITQLKNLIKKNNYDCFIEVDGGIGVENIKAISDAGADMFVCGASIFESKDRHDVIKKMKEIVDN